ncbi:uncharacterized protein LOC109815425 [Cajanus cajan]|uniref:Rapid ALkalinization Factor n=1 Tax=Cajanus cajan TaxID=3821 RepID=A0A151RVS7_CAJCA|nr:uncharacterized protein LOC109815425 [Cajanus cajan]KYP46653.1 hypothetical protein KK1_031750 [Cajanus cajan]
MKKGLLLAFLVLVMIHDKLMMVNANSNKCVTEDCLIGNHMEMEMESEFWFGSHVARMLYDVSQSVNGQTGNRNNKAVNCPTSQNYRGCLPSQNGGGPNNRCGDYNRVC